MTTAWVGAGGGINPFTHGNFLEKKCFKASQAVFWTVCCLCL